MTRQATTAVVTARQLLDLVPDLGAGMSAPARAEAARRAPVTVLELGVGAWTPECLESHGLHPFALLVASGLLVRDLMLAGITAGELLGPGDLVDYGVAADPLLPARVDWTVAEPAQLAVLDDRLLPVLRAWPRLGARLMARSARQSSRLAAQRAISQLPRVEDRLLALFGHLAERWGRIGAAGVVVPLRLTHEALGHLVGARRPTVSLALKALAASGVVARRDDGAWIVRHGALTVLGPPLQPSLGRAVTPN